MELNRTRQKPKPTEISVAIGEILVSGVAIRDAWTLRQAVQNALELGLARADLSATVADRSASTVRAASLRPEHARSDQVLGEQIADRVVAAIRT